MNSLNSILLEGNLVRDPERKETPKGTVVSKFTIALNRYYKGDNGTESEVSYVDIETWGKLAEQCLKYLDKGRGVRVVGRLKQDRWLDKDENTRTRIKVVGEHVEFKPRFTKADESDQAPEEAEQEVLAEATF